MIQFILFVIAVFAWDALKKKLRGTIRRHKPTVALAQPISAKCGCLVIPRQPYGMSSEVVKPCNAHRILLSVQEGR